MKSKSYTTFIEPALIYGGILGIVYIVISVIIHILNANFSVANQIVNIVLPVAGLTYCLYMYRKEYLGNYMSYGRAFGMGVTIMIIAGILAAAYNYIYTSFINPDIFKQAQIIMEEKLINKRLDARQIELVIDKTAKMRTPLFSSLGTLGYLIFFGVISSLIVSAFVKKENEDPFRDVI